MMALQDVLDSVGLLICGHLRPRELYALGSCSRRLRETILDPVQLAKICMDQLPLRLGGGTNYRAEFRAGCSFSNKEELLDFVLGKADVANLVLEGAETREESRRRAREMLLYGRGAYQSFATFHEREDGPIVSIAPRNVTVECQYHREEQTNHSRNWAKYILDRSEFRRAPKDREAIGLVDEWLDCFFSLGEGILFRSWRWSIRHPTLNGSGIMGTGVVIVVGQDDAAEGGGRSTANATVELCRTRLY